MTRCIWTGVRERDGNATDLIEKLSAINLLVAFAYAVKNYLREEYSYDEEDMKDLISHLPRFATPSSTQPFTHQQDSANLSRKSLDLGRANSAASSIHSKKDHLNGLTAKAKEYKLKAHDYPAPTNIPIELSYYFASYVTSLIDRKQCDSSTISTLNSCKLSSSHHVVSSSCSIKLQYILMTPPI